MTHFVTPPRATALRLFTDFANRIGASLAEFLDTPTSKDDRGHQPWIMYVR